MKLWHTEIFYHGFIVRAETREHAAALIMATFNPDEHLTIPDEDYIREQLSEVTLEGEPEIVYTFYMG